MLWAVRQSAIFDQEQPPCWALDESQTGRQQSNLSLTLSSSHSPSLAFPFSLFCPLSPIWANFLTSLTTALSPSFTPFLYSVVSVLYLSSFLHTIDSLQTVSILLLLAVTSSMLISSLRSLLSPRSPLASSSHSFIVSNPWPSVLARLYTSFSSKLPASLQLVHSSLLGLAWPFAHSTVCLCLFISFSSTLWVRNRGEAWRAEISILRKKKKKKHIRTHKLTELNPQGGFMDSQHSVEQEARAAMRDQPLDG